MKADACEPAITKNNYGGYTESWGFSVSLFIDICSIWFSVSENKYGLHVRLQWKSGPTKAMPCLFS